MKQLGLGLNLSTTAQVVTLLALPILWMARGQPMGAQG
jgi:hypothetical protein